MRIAIIHEDFATCGGGERIALLLAQALPADLITFSVAPEVRQFFPPTVAVRTLAPPVVIEKDAVSRRHAFSTLNVRGRYDFFILSGNDALCSAKRHAPNLAYIHSLPRELYQPRLPVSPWAAAPFARYGDSPSERMFERLAAFKNRRWPRPLREPFATIIEGLRFVAHQPRRWRQWRVVRYRLTKRSYLRNLRYVQRWLASGRHIQTMMRTHYQQESSVVYPPVETTRYRWRPAQGYWLSVNRIHPSKRIELQLAAFAKLPEERLHVVGAAKLPEHAAYLRWLQRVKPSNVEFLGLRLDARLREELSECCGLLHTALDEDFGLAAVEAMASGKPVVAVDEGGCRETVVDGVTGRLVSADAEALAGAIREVSKNSTHYREACLQQAKKFDAAIFLERMRVHLSP